MPYYIEKDNPECKSGWMVVDEGGDAFGCHKTKQEAIDQAVAISLSTDEPFEGERAAIDSLNVGDYVSWNVLDPEILAEVFMVDGEYAVLKLYKFEDGIFHETNKLMILNIFKLERIPRPEFVTQEMPHDEPAQDSPNDVPNDLPQDEEPMSRYTALANDLIARLEPKTEKETMGNTDKWLDVAYRIKSRLEGEVTEGRSTAKHEQRVNVADFEVRETSDGMNFEGYAAVFNSDSLPLPFIERIAPGAFKRSLQSRNEVKLLWNHDSGEPLASLRGGTLKLTEDDRGLKVSATLASTTRGRDVAELIRSKTIDSMSFGFSVIKDTWNGDVRTLDSVRLYEVSIVSSPAYEATAGTVAVRSAEGIDADKLAEGLMRLESGEELSADDAALINDVVARLTKTEEVQEVQGDILALKQKKLALLLKGN